MIDNLHWLDVSKRVTFKHCVLAFKCQTGLAPFYLASSCVSSWTVPGRVNLRSASTNKDKNDQAARIFLLLPSCMEQSPQCSQNLGPIAVSFQEKLENVSFSKLILCNSYIICCLIRILFSLSTVWQLLWASPWWTFIRSSVFQMSVGNYLLQIQFRSNNFNLLCSSDTKLSIFNLSA